MGPDARPAVLHRVSGGPAALHAVALAASCLVSYLLTVRLLGAVHFVSTADDHLGGMWAVIATIFVYRTGYQQSLASAVSRSWATLLSFALCLVYLLFLPFTPIGLAVLIGVGSLVLTLLGRPGDVVTTGITTAVVMVVAGLSPHDAWQQPILRLGDTLIGIGVGLGAVWIAHRVIPHPPRPTPAAQLRRQSRNSDPEQADVT